MLAALWSSNWNLLLKTFLFIPLLSRLEMRLSLPNLEVPGFASSLYSLKLLQCAVFFPDFISFLQSLCYGQTFCLSQKS